MGRTVLTIDLDALKSNYRTVCSLTSAKVCCVLKSNAYGHGSVAVAKALAQEGCASFAVSSAREALELIQHGISGEILIMGPCEQQYHNNLLKQNVLLTVTCIHDLLELEASCVEVAASCRVHLKIDTGFHRLGFEPTVHAAEQIAKTLELCPHVHALGIYSHLGLIERELDEAQCRRLLAMRDYLRAFSVTGLEMHLCDSISLVRYPQWHFDRVRVGAFLYGVRPSRTDHMEFSCLETITFETTISQVRHVRKGEAIGYGEERINHDAVIATLCAGYGDGYPRRLSNGIGEVLIAGKRAKVIGLVCMDQMMADVTDIPEAERGMNAVLLGGGISYQEYADWVQTNRNECLAMLSRRPVRYYTEKGTIIAIRDDLLQEGV
ncbi:MAG: alanine racemase [Clostridiales bacterium]|nr:alanine racemase [Clostridiales bacterium]